MKTKRRIKSKPTQEQQLQKKAHQIAGQLLKLVENIQEQGLPVSPDMLAVVASSKSTAAVLLLLSVN